jgi:hypothetical protein
MEVRGMPAYVDDILAPAAVLNELAALGVAEVATLFEHVGQVSVANSFWKRVRQHRIQALHLRALEGAKRAQSSRSQQP